MLSTEQNEIATLTGPGTPGGRLDAGGARLRLRVGDDTAGNSD